MAKRLRRSILCVLLLAIAVTVGVWFTSKYRIAISQREPEIFAEFRASLSPSLTGASSQPQVPPAELLEELVRESRFPEVLDAVLRNEKVRNLAWLRGAADPQKMLDESIRWSPIESNSRSATVRVWVEGPPPEDAYELTNALVEAAEQQILDRRQHQEHQRIEVRREILRRAEEDLRIKRDRLRTLDSQLAANEQQANVRFERNQKRAALLEEEIAKIDVQLLDAQIESQLLREEQAGGGSEEPAGIAELTKRIEQLGLRRKHFADELSKSDVEGRDFTVQWVEREILAEEVDLLRENVRRLRDRVAADEIDLNNSPPPIVMSRAPQRPR